MTLCKAFIMHWRNSHRRINDFLWSSKSRTVERDSVNVRVLFDWFLSCWCEGGISRGRDGSQRHNAGNCEFFLMGHKTFYYFIYSQRKLLIHYFKSFKMENKEIIISISLFLQFYFYQIFPFNLIEMSFRLQFTKWQLHL